MQPDIQQGKRILPDAQKKMICDSEKTTVLLSLYGECVFLEDFLESLKKQSRQNFKLLYRFDGSRDAAAAALLTRYDFSEELTQNGAKGLPLTYWELLKNSPESDYIMFADQDDIWHPGKIEASLDAMKNAEKQFGKHTPLLIHSDLRVVDRELTEIAPSFIKYQVIDPAEKELKSLMVQNNVTGCTVMINKALRGIVKFPEYSICHDWYLALTASAFGRIIFIDTPLIDYRQHDDNVFGAVQRKNLLNRRNQRQYLHDRLTLTWKQAECFLELHRETLSARQIRLLEAWSGNLYETSYLKRLFNLFRWKFKKNDWLRTLGMWWAI